MTLNGVMAVTLRYFAEFVKPVFQRNRVDLWRNSCTSLLYFVVLVRYRRYESSRSLSYLLVGFLFNIKIISQHKRIYSVIIATELLVLANIRMCKYVNIVKRLKYRVLHLATV